MPSKRNTLLLEAVRLNKVFAVQKLLAEGADVRKQDRNGWPLLHLTTNADIARLLIRHGADVNVRNRFGETPLCYLIDSKSSELEVLIELVRNGADVNCTDRNGNTPLHLAVEHCPRLLLDLLKYGAYAFQPNMLGLTAVDIANDQIAKLLLKYQLLKDPETIEELWSANYAAKYYSFWHRCYMEIGKMKTVEMVRSLSLYDFLKVEDRRTLVLCTTNIPLARKLFVDDFLQQFTIYKDDIVDKFKIADRLAAVLNQFQYVRIFAKKESDNPSDNVKEVELDVKCKQILSKYLNFEDMTNVLIAATLDPPMTTLTSTSVPDLKIEEVGSDSEVAENPS